MKKQLTFTVFAAAFLWVLFACNRKSDSGVPAGFRVEGQVEKEYSGLLYGRIPDTSFAQGYRMDTIRIVEGKFAYSGVTDKFQKLAFYSKDSLVMKNVTRGYVPSKANELVFYVFPGAKIKASGQISSFVGIYPSGDPANDELAQFHKIVFPLYDERAEKTRTMIMTEDTMLAASLKPEVENLTEQLNSAKKDFMETHSGSVVAGDILLTMMTRRELSNEEALGIFEGFGDSFQQNPFYSEVLVRIEGIKSTAIGKLVPDVKTYSTLDSAYFDLESLRGKFVVIDFWGVWCAACVAEMPELAVFYSKHQNQMEVVAVNSGDNAERIQKFLKAKPEYSWIQLLSSTQQLDDNFVSRFNVSAFPTKFVIDPTGKIVAKYVGTNPELYTFLENEFEKID